MNGAHRLDERAGGLERACRGLDRGARPRARPAGRQPASISRPMRRPCDVALEALPVDRLRRQAHRVARRRAGRSTPIISAASATVRVIGPATRPAYGGSIGIAAEAGLEREDAAPAGRQAHRAADVGADVQRPVAGGDAGGRARAAAARVLAQVPRVARQAVKARQARRQHAVVGHRRLAEDHRAGLAQARRRRRVARRRHQLGRGGAERHRRAGGGDVLLDRRRHAVERADVLAGATWRSQRASETRAAASAASASSA